MRVQTKARIQRYLKQDDVNWLYTELSGLDQHLHDCTLDFSDVFRRIDFGEL